MRVDPPQDLQGLPAFRERLLLASEFGAEGGLSAARPPIGRRLVDSFYPGAWKCETALLYQWSVLAEDRWCLNPLVAMYGLSPSVASSFRSNAEDPADETFTSTCSPSLSERET